MKKIVYFKKIEEVTPKSEYTSLITNIFGRRLDVYSEEGSIYVLTDPKLAYLTQNIDEIMELEMNNIIFKHISCKEVYEDKKNSEVQSVVRESKKNKVEDIEEIKNQEKPVIIQEKKEKLEVKINKNDEVEKVEVTQKKLIIEEKKEELDKVKDEESVKLTKRKEREEKEKILESLENQKSEKKIGMKETCAVLFTILFALINVYLWVLINAKEG